MKNMILAALLVFLYSGELKMDIINKLLPTPTRPEIMDWLHSRDFDMS